MTAFLSNRAIYETVIRDAVPQARERLWIGIARCGQLNAPPVFAQKRDVLLVA